MSIPADPDEREAFIERVERQAERVGRIRDYVPEEEFDEVTAWRIAREEIQQ